jgi:uncharacterized protein (DUF1499 family)
MNTSAQIKEKHIKDYITGVDFTGEFSVREIKENLRKIIKETPGIEIVYKRDTYLAEVKGGKDRVVEKVKTVSIAFTDGEDDNGIPRVHKVTYFI